MRHVHKSVIMSLSYVVCMLCVWNVRQTWIYFSSPHVTKVTHACFYTLLQIKLLLLLTCTLILHHSFAKTDRETDLTHSHTSNTAHQAVAAVAVVEKVCMEPSVMLCVLQARENRCGLQSVSICPYSLWRVCVRAYVCVCVSRAPL